ncbi:MAG: hypothetical protein OEV53_00635 [Nitrospira sp.]|nr:hypothetical protein [Nitrospira sp.]MDH5193246.1 hypothetical protein [Nitrospira sp.]
MHPDRTPAGVVIVHRAYALTPVELIPGIVTERGVASPVTLLAQVQEPFLTDHPPPFGSTRVAWRRTIAWIPRMREPDCDDDAPRASGREPPPFRT